MSLKLHVQRQCVKFAAIRSLSISQQKLTIDHNPNTLFKSRTFGFTGKCVSGSPLMVTSEPKLEFLDTLCKEDRFHLTAIAENDGDFTVQVEQPELNLLAKTQAKVLELKNVSNFYFEGQNATFTIKGDYLYIYSLVWNASNFPSRAYNQLRIVDISNPASPAVLETIDYPKYVQVIGTDRYAYAFREGPNSKFWIEVLDLTKPKEDRIANSVTCCASGMGSAWMDFPYSVTVGDTIYTKELSPGGEAGALDVSDPLNPKVLPNAEASSAFRMSEFKDGYFIGNYFYTHDKDVLLIYRPSETANWPLIKTLSFDGKAGWAIGHANDLLYVRSNDQMFTVDVSWPENPRILKKDQLGKAKYVIKDNLYFFTELYYNGFGLRYGLVKSGLTVPEYRPSVGVEYYDFKFHKGYILAISKNRVDVFSCLPGYQCPATQEQ